MFNKVSKTFQYGQHTVTLETGEIARQASGAVMVSMDDTVVLATVVAKDDIKPGQDFFPLTVDYIEKSYAAGRIPGSFFKREGRPSEKETLTSRLIDRPIRPLFPDGYFNEVQVIIHVLSVNPEVDPDIPSMIGASAALCVSGIPFNGPLGAARVGYIDGQYVLNPNASQLPLSQLDLVVAGTEQAVLMVESEAKELPEDVMLGAVVYGHEQMKVVIQAIDELVRDGGKPEVEWEPPAKNEALIAEPKLHCCSDRGRIHDDFWPSGLCDQLFFYRHSDHHHDLCAEQGGKADLEVYPGFPEILPGAYLLSGHHAAADAGDHGTAWLLHWHLCSKCCHLDL